MYRGKPWFESETFIKDLNPACYYFYFGTVTAQGIYPNPDLTSGCFVASAPKGQIISSGCKITEVRVPGQELFTPVETWADIRRYLEKFSEGQPESVYVKFTGIKTGTDTLKLKWAK